MMLQLLTSEERSGDRMTATLQPPPAETPDAGVIEEARARQRAHRRAAGAAVTVLAVAVILLVSIGGGEQR